ncbi:carbohydrate ABC transporter permease [Paenibacillus chitinolyticus]|uniref:carbohydrate ABC transporter permease n=1 Tax=Paenibacillus chitinolyticus TaxID=79263 RepID=UPI001C43A2E3|nr:sugar ABC transporter permease [Paenibacillus chitinolyticus]MBV6713889.1 sugar ABC transporter permease [Paenibacillus chitinolyticus]
MNASTVSHKAAAGQKSKKRRLDHDPIGYALITPFYLFLFVFVLLPILMNIYLSFTNYDMNRMDFIGFKNYKVLLSDTFFWISLKNTVIYTFFTLFFTLALGLVFAVLLNNKLVGLPFFRTGFFTPHVTSMVAVSMIWLWIYEPSRGIANTVLGFFQIQGKQWLYDANWAMVALIIMGIWKFVGYNMVIYLAGLQGVPRDLYEAASVDGANSLQRFFYITVPMLKPITFFLLITGLINNFNVFEQIKILTNGGPMNSTTTIVHQIYNRAFGEFQLGYSSAMATVLLGIIAVITIVNFKYGQGNDID